MLDVAAEVFGEQGYAGANMDEIAARCGVTKPMLYNYFGSKKGLFQAVSDDIIKDILDQAQGVVGITDPDELVEKGGALLLDILSERYKLWMQARVSALSDSDLADQMRQFRQLLLDVLAVAFSGFKPDALTEDEAYEIVLPYAHAALGAIESGIELWTERADLTERLNEEIVPSMTEAVVGAVKIALANAANTKQG